MFDQPVTFTVSDGDVEETTTAPVEETTDPAVEESTDAPDDQTEPPAETTDFVADSESDTTAENSGCKAVMASASVLGIIALAAGVVVRKKDE